MKTQYIGIGIIILILIGLGYFFYTTEGFQIIGKTNKPIPGFSGSFSNVSLKSETIVVNSNLKNLTDPAIITALGSIETGMNNPTYAVIDISDYTGKSLWTTGKPRSTITTPNQYQLKFKSPITTTKFQEGLTRTSLNMTYIGTDFTSDFIFVEKNAKKWPKDDLSGTLWNLTDKYYLGIFKTITDGVSPPKVRNDDGTYSFTFDIERVEDTNGKAVWNKGYKSDTSGNTNIMGDKKIDKYSIYFSKPVSLSSAKEIIQSKTIFNYLGLQSTDKADAPDRPTYYDSTYKTSTYPSTRPAYTGGMPTDVPYNFLPDRSSLTGVNTPEIPTTSGIYNTLTGSTTLGPTSEGGYIQPSYKYPIYKDNVGNPIYSYPTYQDPAAQRGITQNNLSKFTTSYGQSIKTNRIKIRSLFKTIILPVVIKSLETGSNAKVVEILNETGKAVWPATTPPYQGSDMPEVFTIGFNNMIDVKSTIQPYIQKFMPSITYLNPAMPRT